jgi:molecular chaperone DnaK
LFLGESPLIRNNIKLGKIRLEGIPPAGRGQPQIKVEFSVDASCAIIARASLQGAQVFAEETFQPPDELSEEFIAKALADAESSRAADEAELLA